MRLEPPVEQYLTGDKPSHCAFSNLYKHMKAWDQEEIEAAMRGLGHIDSDGKVTKHALVNNVADLCEKRILWNVTAVKKAMISYENIRVQNEATKNAKKKEVETEKWVELSTIGTYFGVSAIVVGKWMDQLGFREAQKLEKNSSGAYDMLDVARQEQERQAAGFLSKKATEKALNAGVARVITVTNHKKKDVDITQWNLALCKAILQRAGHELDTERKMMLKGKGKNGDVKVLTADDRAKDLYNQWRKLQASPATAARAKDVFKGQPKVILLKVEALMNKPGFLTK